LLFNFSLEHATRRVQVNQDGLKLNSAHQLLVYADDANILGGSVHTVQENTEALQVTSKKNGLAVNADKTKYMVMSGDQYAGRRHCTQAENSSFERVENFKYLEKKPKETKFYSGRVKSRLKSGNVCYQSVLNLLSYSLPT